MLHRSCSCFQLMLWPSEKHLFNFVIEKMVEIKLRYSVLEVSLLLVMSNHQISLNAV